MRAIVKLTPSIGIAGRIRSNAALLLGGEDTRQGASPTRRRINLQHVVDPDHESDRILIVFSQGAAVHREQVLSTIKVPGMSPGVLTMALAATVPSPSPFSRETLPTCRSQGYFGTPTIISCSVTSAARGARTYFMRPIPSRFETRTPYPLLSRPTESSMLARSV